MASASSKDASRVLLSQLHLDNWPTLDVSAGILLAIHCPLPEVVMYIDFFMVLAQECRTSLCEVSP